MRTSRDANAITCVEVRELARPTMHCTAERREVNELPLQEHIYRCRFILTKFVIEYSSKWTPNGPHVAVSKCPELSGDNPCSEWPIICVIYDKS